MLSYLQTRPGDAAVSAYATISQAVAQGKRVVIVFVTNGDAQTIVARELADLPADATPTPRQYLHGAAVLQEMALKVAEKSFGLTWERRNLSSRIPTAFCINWWRIRRTR